MAMPAKVEIVPADRPISIFTKLIVGAGILLLTAITIFAIVELARDTRASLLDGGLRGLVWAIGSVAIALALWLVVLSGRGPLRTHPLASGIVFVAASRLVDVALVAAPLQSDFKGYHDLAVQISQQGPIFADIPAGYPMVLGAIYAVFGAQPLYAQLLNCVIAVATAALLFDVTRRLWGGRAGIWALWLFALAPSQILMTGVLATEAPYALLVLLAIWIAVRLGSRRLAIALAIAGVLGASNYVRATTPVLIPAFAALPFFSTARLRIAVACAGLLVLGFLVVQTPLVIYNEQTKGELSISPVTCGPGWSLLVGTDPDHTGEYNSALIEVVGGSCSPEFDRRAGQIAVERLKAQPLRFARLAIQKFPHMWALESYGYFYTFGTSPGSDKDAGRALLLLSQATYVAIVGLAALGLWRVRSAVPPVVVTILLALVALVAVHTFLEVTPRYHAYFVPLFCMLAAPGAATLRLPHLPGARRIPATATNGGAPQAIAVADGSSEGQPSSEPDRPARGTVARRGGPFGTAQR